MKFFVPKASKKGLIVILIVSLLLTGCSQLFEQSRSVNVLPDTRAEKTASIAAALTATPAFTPTTRVKLPAVLTPLQAARLRTAALAYIADDESAAIKVAKSMDYLDGYGDPSTMCGPLAIAILQDGELLDPNLDLSEYFLLNPRVGNNKELIDNTFPSYKYQKIEIEQSVNKIDFSQHPLMAGDFVYLFSGSGVNFDHMLTVDYVDDTGRAFAVTNLNTPNGYVIQEVMLYDPTQPGVGQMYEWTDANNSALGLTGLGGIWVWRLKETPAELDEHARQFQQNVFDLQNQAGGKWYIYIQKLGDDPLLSEQADQNIHTASTIKIADAILFFKALEKKGVDDIPTFIRTYGTDNRSFNQLLHAMLVDSEEEATITIETWTSETLNLDQTLHDMGYTQTYIIPRQSSAHEMARMLADLYNGELLNETATNIIFNYLAETSPEDSTLLGVIRPSFGPDDILYDKRGEIAAQPIVLADLGLLVHGEDIYVIAIYGFHDTRQNTGSYESLQFGLEQISRAFWQTIQE